MLLADRADCHGREDCCSTTGVKAPKNACQPVLLSKQPRSQHASPRWVDKARFGDEATRGDSWWEGTKPYPFEGAGMDTETGSGRDKLYIGSPDGNVLSFGSSSGYA
ncbi:uncharacterized protein NFIA_030020 [Aspergillus fischeri NRRL 181]|uniref:Uncharacterized protein n=1 Tax=Neosartorya fischeri (strain ATCC 1020 / DSM 3700 / CBS 544.65 / FGSC A1164 / JCM 1740 / NRRL 181 / WB 181) TaxID=331117 RepID=A1D9T9_NEOFI|nr:uncharacterized protein NFIA_030020 [Aspergillus fischeri NRRL 181]EAW20570.1 hypothetical protein NFIA_030020 [Aspergillus fischeri NRRL 181]KAG2025231.1 hypothetical protein GB937_002992 [Aspergillus fischeri]